MTAPTNPGDESPRVKLANAVLLSMLKHRPALAWIGFDADGVYAIDFVYETPYRDPVARRELAPGTVLGVSIVRRLAVMAGVAFGGKGVDLRGIIHLIIGARNATFGVHFSGHGDARVVQICILGDGAPLSGEQMYAWTHDAALIAAADRALRPSPQPTTEPATLEALIRDFEN